MTKRQNLGKIYILALWMILWSLYSCKQPVDTNASERTLSVKIERDPTFLFPGKSMATVETQINTYLFLPLASHDPQTLALIPILIDEIPVGVDLTEGEFNGMTRFDCRIREKARWDNGQPITGYDYLFSIKLYKLENLNTNAAIRSIFQQLEDVEVDPDDPGKFSIYVNRDYHLAKELALVTELIPEYAYDPGHLLRWYDLKQGELIEGALADSTFTAEREKLVDFLNSADCGRKMVVGSGPYRLEEWQSNQYVRLAKKEKYWGAKFPENPFLQAYPEELNFVIYKDNNSAITALKNGNLDLIDEMSGSDFIRIKENERFSGTFNFFSPTQLDYYFIGMNLHSEFLADVNVRKALAHLFDVDVFIANQEMGFGTRLAGPIIPSKRYYNDTLDLISFNLDKAKELLHQAGWSDTDDNSILDKMIQGKKRELELRIHITGKPLGKSIALTLAENMKMAGMKLNIITKEANLIRKDLQERNFDLYPTGTVYGPYPEDLYQSWHSDNDYPGGSNRYGFDDPEADRIIERLRHASARDTIDYLFKKFQEIAYDKQAQIFLYAPTNNLVVNKKWDAQVTVIKPGYRLNQFKLAR